MLANLALSIHFPYCQPINAITQLLRDIGKQGKVRQYGGERECLCVVCDGLPYHLGQHVVENTLVCSLCGDSMLGVESCTKHLQEKHPDQQDTVF